MAKYSVELNDIIESGFKLFDFDYNFYDISSYINYDYFKFILI